MTKVGIAMSGGVDSSVSAALLKREGHQVHGFFMRLPLKGVETHIARVQAVADKLDLPLTIIDMEQRFTMNVLQVFVETYRRGTTPNPCILCNRKIKFGALRKEMLKRGMEKMATGHYARLGITRQGFPAIQRGLDPTKDQSYFLCRLNREQLDSMLLPLGRLCKTEVYKMAAALELQGLHGPESQDVCFLAGRDIAQFFSHQGVKDFPGEIVTTSGRVLGRHRGLWHYTIGQRRGLGLPDATPWYVQRLDPGRNRVIICKPDELITSRIQVTDVQWAEGSPGESWQGKVQVRGRHTPSSAIVEKTGKENWLITFAEPQRALTPGQFAVFYEDDLVCGSGIMVSAEDTFGTGAP